MDLLPMKLNNKITNLLASGLLILMLGLAFFSMRGDSATMDELAHIPAGYSYITQKDMRLNPEHPPLLKDLAGLSVWLGSKLTASPIHFPSQVKSWQEDVNGQWDFGGEFLYKADNNADQIIFWARLPMILIMLILGFYVFKWARELYGNKAGLLALFLYSLSPTFLAHGRLVTTDVGAAAAFFIATYYFLKWLQSCGKSDSPHSHQRKNLIIAGLVFGLALLTKFSLVLLIPYFVFLTIIWIIVGRNWQRRENTSFNSITLRAGTASSKARRAINSLSQNSPARNFAIAGRHFLRLFKNPLRIGFGLLLVGLIALALIWPIYQFHVWNYPPERQQADTEFLLQSFGKRWLADPVVWMSDKPILRPYAQFFLGLLMVIQRAVGGNTTYFLGEVSAAGWHYYFPVVFLIKVPLAFLILILIALFSSVYRIKKPFWQKPCLRFFQWTREHFAEFALLAFLALYWVASIRSNLNIGVRHVLPTFPIFYVLISGQISQWLAISFQPILEKLRFSLTGILSSIKTAILLCLKIYFKYLLVLVLLFWYAFGTIKIYPHFLAYFNELAGGPNNGYKYVVDSNLDWGQDLKRLAQFVEENKIKTIYLDYFGGGSAEYYLKEKYQPWWGHRNPMELSPNSWLAVSATLLQGGRGWPAPGFNQKTGYYNWLNQYEPVTVIGHSIFVYNIE
jgi:4-amino-4-deoxy-L-arabinose transferase-like glycosyltransferase